MVQAGIWMVYPPELTWFLLVASWVQREVWRFDDYVDIISHLDSKVNFTFPRLQTHPSIYHISRGEVLEDDIERMLQTDAKEDNSEARGPAIHFIGTWNEDKMKAHSSNDNRFPERVREQLVHRH
jgi:hypothetical protein